MPILSDSSYSPGLLFKNKHFNTIYRTLFTKYAITYKRERIELPDGDFIDIDIAPVNSRKAIIAIHGLEGSSNSTYIQSLALLANQQGYDVVAVNLRGCSGENNRLIATYHSGKTEDIQYVLNHLISKNNYDSYHIVGYSLGGNMALKYMGENGSTLSHYIKSAVSVSVPCDLKASAIQMNRFSNRIYLKRFLDSMKAKAIQKYDTLPNAPLRKETILSCNSFKDFDDAYTAPAHGFDNAEHYWKSASCKQFIPTIKKPTLLITALDDPFFTKACYPFKEAKENTYFYFETPTYGGHVGFRTSLLQKDDNWCEKRILQFINQQ